MPPLTTVSTGGIDDGVHQPQQGIAFQQAVGVQVAEVRRAAEVDAGVEGIRLAPAHFADHQQIGNCGIDVIGANGRSGDVGMVGPIHLHQPVTLHQAVKGHVG